MLIYFVNITIYHIIVCKNSSYDTQKKIFEPLPATPESLRQIPPTSMARIRPHARNPPLWEMAGSSRLQMRR